jgi:hypothetical protein
MEEGWTFLGRRVSGGSPPRTHQPHTQPAGQQQAAGGCGGAAGGGQAGSGDAPRTGWGWGWGHAGRWGGCYPTFQGCPGQQHPSAPGPSSGAQAPGGTQQERVVYVPVPVMIPSAIFAPFTCGRPVTGCDLASLLGEVAWRMMAGAGRPPAPPGSCAGGACACGSCTCRASAGAAPPAPAAAPSPVNVPGSASPAPPAQGAPTSEGVPDQQAQAAADGSAQDGTQM